MRLRYDAFVLCFFLCCYTLVACKKDDKGLTPIKSGSYIFEKAGDFSSMRLFTKAGEIKDQGLIDQYKNKYATHFEVSGNARDTFKIINDSRAEHIVDTGMSMDFNITGKGDHYQFQGKDTTYSFSVQADPERNAMGKYKPWFVSTPLPTSTGVNYIIKSFQHYYASAGTNTLVLPMVNAVRFHFVRDGQAFSFGFNSYKINNLFDETYHTTLSNTDTILVQTYNLTYKRTDP